MTTTNRSTATLAVFVLMVSSLVGQCLSVSEHDVQLVDDCRDSPHHSCALIAENDDCDAHSKSGDIYGDTLCRVSCGRCTVVDNTITTDSECYSFGQQQQEITLTFTNVKPAVDDWIGIYKANIDDKDFTYDDNEDDDHLDELATWYWLCGNKRDRCKVGVGSVTVPWLPPGKYRAILARNRHNTKGPSTRHDKDSRFAQSSMFEVVRGGACSGRRKAFEEVDGDVDSRSITDTKEESYLNFNLRGRRN